MQQLVHFLQVVLGGIEGQMVNDVAQSEFESGVLGMEDDGLHGISFFAGLKRTRGIGSIKS